MDALTNWTTSTLDVLPEPARRSLEDMPAATPDEAPQPLPAADPA